MRIEVLLDLKTRLGESPVWDVEQQRLWWVDSLDGRLFAAITIIPGELTLTLTPGGAHHAVATPRSKHDYDNNQSHTCR